MLCCVKLTAMRKIKSLKIERKTLFVFEDRKPSMSHFGDTLIGQLDTTTTTITLTSLTHPRAQAYPVTRR